MKIITIGIITYNKFEYIFELLESVLNQTYQKIELIISDDGSKKFPIRKIEEFIEKNRKDNILIVKILSNKINEGIVKNANRIIQNASGEIIKLIGGDDAFYDENVISTVMDYFENEKVDFVFSDSLICNDKLKPVKDQKMYNHKKIAQLNNKERFNYYVKSGLPPAAVGTFYSIKIFKKLGGFDEKYTYIEDAPMWLKLLRSDFKIAYLERLTVKYRMGVGISSNHSSKTEFEEKYSVDHINIFENEILPNKELLSKFIFRFSYYKYLILKYRNNKNQLTIIKLKYLDILCYQKYCGLQREIKNGTLMRYFINKWKG